MEVKHYLERRILEGPEYISGSHGYWKLKITEGGFYELIEVESFATREHVYVEYQIDFPSLVMVSLPVPVLIVEGYGKSDFQEGLLELYQILEFS